MTPTFTSPRRLALELLRPHARALSVAAGLAAVVAACRGGLVWLVRDVLDGMLRAGSSLRWIPWAVVALFAVQGAARVARTMLTRRAALQAEAALRARLFAALLTLPAPDLQRLGRGEAMTRLIHDCGKVRTAVGAAVTAVQRPLSAVAVLGSALWMAPRLAFWALLALPAVAGVVVWSGRAARTTSREHLRSLGRLERTLRDALLGLRTIQAYGAEERVRADARGAEAEQVRAALHSHRAKVVGPPVVELVAAVAFALVLVVGGAQVSAGTLSPGALTAFLVALGLLNEPLKGIAQSWSLWQDATAGLQRVIEVLGAAGEPPEIGLTAPATPRTIELRGVWVERGRGPVLRGVDLRLRRGEIVVICGESGAGKSTLLDLIGGFVGPSAGALRWDGEPAAALPLSARRGAIAWVDQSTWLGAGTVQDAVRLGRPDASEEAVRGALLRAGLDPQGALLTSFDSGSRGVGDGGEPLSGGEQQRVAIARALLRDAPVVLLDEPTAHLDPKTERALLDTLEALRPGRIVVVATHRRAPLRRATRAFELADGTLRPLALPAREVAS